MAAADVMPRVLGDKVVPEAVSDLGAKEPSPYWARKPPTHRYFVVKAPAEMGAVKPLQEYVGRQAGTLDEAHRDVVALCKRHPYSLRAWEVVDMWNEPGTWWRDMQTYALYWWPE